MVNVLVIDDEKEFRDIVVSELKDLFNINVKDVSSGNEAITLLGGDEVFDIVISDYNMANGNGADVFNFVKKSKLNSRFVLYTGSHIEERDVFQGEPFQEIIPKYHIGRLFDFVETFVKGQDT